MNKKSSKNEKNRLRARHFKIEKLNLMEEEELR